VGAVKMMYFFVSVPKPTLKGFNVGLGFAGQEIHKTKRASKEGLQGWGESVLWKDTPRNSARCDLVVVTCTYSLQRPLQHVASVQKGCFVCAQHLPQRSTSSFGTQTCKAGKTNQPVSLEVFVRFASRLKKIGVGGVYVWLWCSSACSDSNSFPSVGF